MAIILNETDGGATLEVHATGKLTHADYQLFSPKFEEMLKRRGKINVLFLMSDFHGWEASAVWDDLKLDVKHFSHIQRIAMVGDKAWEKGMSIFCRPFITAKIRYFDVSALPEARAWVAAG